MTVRELKATLEAASGDAAVMIELTTEIDCRTVHVRMEAESCVVEVGTVWLTSSDRS